MQNHPHSEKTLISSSNIKSPPHQTIQTERTFVFSTLWRSINVCFKEGRVVPVQREGKGVPLRCQPLLFPFPRTTAVLRSPKLFHTTAGHFTSPGPMPKPRLNSLGNLMASEQFQQAGLLAWAWKGGGSSWRACCGWDALGRVSGRAWRLGGVRMRCWFGKRGVGWEDVES